MNQRSSFISLAERVSALNNNSVEIITKLSDIVSSKDSAVSINLIDQEGNSTTYYMPTVGYLKKEIDKINSNIKRLVGIESTTNIIDGESSKRIYVTDLNREPYPINILGEVTTFESVPNHFFESLMNPLLSVEIDLTDKVTSDINKILSRRYIIKFERNADFSLTEDGLSSYRSFESKFLGRTDIDINELIDWYEDQLEVGILKDTTEPYDEQIFDLNTNEVNYHGLFSVIKTETDTLNNKFWYHLNTLNYYTKEGYDRTLSIGDTLILNRLNSAARWEIKEVNTESSNFRVVLERVEGYEPLPIGTNMLRIYSDLTYSKKVKISIGFDEHCVIFIKPINTENNVISTTWSKGTCFYTNDLGLKNAANIDLSQYYLRNVYDYGKLLKDMILKKIPAEYGETPLKVSLDTDNFKVVQINKHLTDTENTKTLKNLQSQKITVQSKLSQINDAIIEKTKELNTKKYATTLAQNAARSELGKLILDQEKEAKSLYSIITQISSKKNETTEQPKFRVRGFWNIPAPIYNGRTEPQHVIQFRVQYRYSAKTGEINPTEGYTIKATYNSEKYTANGEVVVDTTTVSNTESGSPSGGGGSGAAVLKGNIKASVVNSGSLETLVSSKTGYFSNWNEFLTDVRKRYWDVEAGVWYWKIEDVEDADTPNINQLDIPIQKNEKVEIRIKSISEVGWPDTLIESDWSDVLPVEFPDNLSDVANENEFILKEASKDEAIVGMESTLNSRGVYKHVQDSYYSNETYYAHNDKTIQVNFKDNEGNYISLYDYLLLLTVRIKTLEDQISKAKGELEIYLVTPSGSAIKMYNGMSRNILVELEDYATVSGSTSSRSYFNNITLMDDYYLDFRNISTSSYLGLVSSRLYDTGYTSNTFYVKPNDKSLVVDYNNDLYTQFDNQFIWFSDNSGSDNIYSGTTSATTYQVLGSTYYNIGTNSESPDTSTPIFNISNCEWTNQTVPPPETSDLYVTLHPKVTSMEDLIETGQEKLKIIKANDSFRVYIHAYFKLNGNTEDDVVFTVPTSGSPSIKYRKIKVFVETETSVRPFEFELRFRFKQYKDVLAYTPVSDETEHGYETE